VHLHTYEKYPVHPYWQCKIVDPATLFNYQGKGCWVKKRKKKQHENTFKDKACFMFAYRFATPTIL
jgi:hypothetical protein